tara:strand:- start:239 stop:1000 length:762 start_codon:yes stop_codon:yes gene_type:complete
MLEDPYRWVEAVRNRREYLEDQLKNASPVVAVRYIDGILLLTTTPGPRKVFEIYNQISFASIGHPADIEKLRKLLIDVAHIEGFNLSASDVNLSRLVNFGIAPIVKESFDDLIRSPYLARALLAELDPVNDGHSFYTVDPDGNFEGSNDFAAIGSDDSIKSIKSYLHSYSAESSFISAFDSALRAWAFGRFAVEDKSVGEELKDEDISSFLNQHIQGYRIECGVLECQAPTTSKFRLISRDEISAVLKEVGSF